MTTAVAIITRTKNRPQLLERAFESVLGQTSGDWVHVVVNDGGDPGPVDDLAARHAERHAGRLKVVHNPTSLGMEAASNVGIRASASRHVVIHDDDDSWQPSFLEETTGFLAASGGRYRGVVTHSWKIVETIGDAIVEESRELLNAIENITAATLLATNLFPPIAFLFDREAMETVGLYREDLPVLGDWEFNLRFIERFDIGVLPRPLANWHHRPACADPAVGNSIFSGADKHAAYRALLRNEMLRRDFDANRLGKGVVAGLGAMIEALLHTRLNARDMHVFKELAEDVARRDVRIVQLHTDLERHIAEIQGLQSQVGELRAAAAERDAKIADLHHQLEEHIGLVQRLQDELRVVHADAEWHRAELRKIQGTRLWRVAGQFIK